LILAILVVSVLVYVFFEVPLVRGVRREAIGTFSMGWCWYVTFHDEGVFCHQVLLPAKNMTICAHGICKEVTVPYLAPVEGHPVNVPSSQDKEIIDQFLRQELGIEAEEIDTVFYEGTFLYYEYECSLSYKYFRIGYYREWKLFQFSK